MNQIFLLLLVSGIIEICQSTYTASRLGDYPTPDFTKTIKLSTEGYDAFAEVNHGFGVVPFHVRVYATSKDGDNAGYAFEGVGACQNDGKGLGSYGGILFAYNKKSIRLWAPTIDGKVIFVGEGWGGNTNSQSSSEADVTVEAWKFGPSPSYQKVIQIHTQRKSVIELEHPLLQVPELISVRVSATNKKMGDFMFNAVSASQTSSKSRSFGGVIFAYTDKTLMLWTPNKSKTGCIHVGKRWGNGKYAQNTIQNCTIHIRLWVNAMPSPAFQTKWKVFSANQHKDSYTEIKHDLKIMPSMVKVQYRIPNEVHALTFEATGSVQTTSASSNHYGGILFAYSNTYVRLWLPTSSNVGQTSAIFVGEGWGLKNSNFTSVSAEVRIQVYTDRCFGKKEIRDAQGYCRDVNDTSLTQEMTAWGKCSNPCGPGFKKRELTDCIGQSLQTVINCQFNNEMCGFKPEGFPWAVTTGISAQKASHLLQIPSQGPTKDSHFVFSNTSNHESGDYGALISKDLTREEGCLLSFKYATESYFGRLRVDVVKPNGKLKEDLWHMTDTQVMKSVWRRAYINIGRRIGAIKEVHIVHQLEHSDCPGSCHPVAVTDIVLECERRDPYVLSTEECKEKESTLSSCMINVFQPYSKGLAWTVKNALNTKKKDIGQFVTAQGRKGDLIAIYKFKVMKKGRYQLWLDSFALNITMNAITVQIFPSGEKISRDLIYNMEDSLWLPFSTVFQLQAGTYFLKLFQSERNFHYKNLMIAPVHIDVWSDLGMQSRFIPDSAFQSIGGQTDSLVVSRLNGLGAWMPTDTNKGRFYLEIQLPEVALINKIATQGGKWLDTSPNNQWHCQTDSYKIKFSLDGRSFAYYRNNTLKDVYLFAGNSGKPDEIVEHTLAYVLVARAVRFYPQEFSISGCLRIELYGYYISQSMCPQLESKVQEDYCEGDGSCAYPNAKCQLVEGKNTSECACIKSYHGDQCNLSGCSPDPCKNSAECIGDNYNFICKCKTGFKGRYCEIPCPKGTFGINCNMKCNCPDIEYCDPKTGACSCMLGYHGIHCDIPCTNLTYGKDCKEKCSCKNFTECDHKTGLCQCPVGYYGEQCQLKCLHGFFGRDCSQKCNCDNGGTCSGKDGLCDCLAGWHGLSCNETCPEGRYGKLCANICQKPKNSRCDPINGHTICFPGFNGNHCQFPCSKGTYGEGCKFTCNCDEAHTEKCDPKSGACFCRPGYKGVRCESMCKDTWGLECANECTCKNGATCNIEIGTCLCAPGYLGKNCEKTCDAFFYGPDCSKRCNCSENAMKCRPQDGVCSCKRGYQGKDCTEKCQKNYWGRNCAESCKCLNEAACDHRDGFCYCPDGYQGQFCGQECDEGWYGRNCASQCQCKNDAYCDSIDGHCECNAGFRGIYCQRQCEDGFYGLHCAEKCKCITSQSESCSHVNGSCNCLPGYQGNICDQECDDGFFGQLCKSQCSCHYSKLPCSKINGSCTCNIGFTGQHCMDDCDWNHYGSQCKVPCVCGDNKLCNNINGECFDALIYSFKINLLVNTDIFSIMDAKHLFKRNFEKIINQCYHPYLLLTVQDPGKNISSLGHCNVVDNTDSHLSPKRRSIDTEDLPDQYQFVARIRKIESMYTLDDAGVSSITLILMHNESPVNASVVSNILKYIGKENLSSVLKHPYYIGAVVTSKHASAWHHGSMRYVVIGIAIFGGLLIIFLIALVVRCTRKVQNPSPFKKIRRNMKEIEMPMLPNNNSHMLAFENPYYDVIAAMGLDDDIEEDYYNPLYDLNLLDLHSDSEAETDEMYYFRNNQYRSNQYNYDKDSGFSSGTLAPPLV